MSSGYRVAVVGATGNVGREILNILAERQFPLAEVAAVASPRSTGDIIDFGDSGQELKVKNLEHFDFAGWDIALFAAGSDVSKVHAPRAAAAARCCEDQARGRCDLPVGFRRGQAGHGRAVRTVPQHLRWRPQRAGE